jgi:prepilin-type N-terminal cleavage/methylation domain-containing protein
MLNRKNSKKLWFTLIEMLIVIVIIWILAAYLIPRITWAQWKARDVARKADVNQVVSAIFSAQLDGKLKEKNNMTNFECLSGLNDVLVTSWHYLSKMEKDPGGAWYKDGCDYYGYYIRNWSIAVVAKLEWEWWNANSWVVNLTNITDIKTIRDASSNETWNYYVQIY